MKKVGWGIILALVLVLVSVIASASVVSAAKPIHTANHNATAVATIYEVDGTNQSFSIGWSWDNYGASGYCVKIYDYTARNVPYYGGIQMLESRTTSSAVGPIWINTAEGTVADPAHVYVIYLYLFRSNGALLCQTSSWFNFPY